MECGDPSPHSKKSPCYGELPVTILPLVAAISLSVLAADAPANPCANGSFEQLAPSGFPIAWGPLGKVEAVGDAHSGKRALRLVRTNEPPDRETGINGPALDRLRGGIDFHYQAVAAKDVKLHVYAIPLAADGIERTGAPRAAFLVPKDHVGDGQWHHARLKYDFTKNEKVKSVLFAARLEGTSGELLLDDFSYIERIGPALRVGTIRIEEDPKRPGERGTVSAAVENTGDEPVKDVRVTIEAPKGLKAIPESSPLPFDGRGGASQQALKASLTELHLGDLAPDAKVTARATLEGPRLGESHLKITATAGPLRAESALRIAPHVVVRSWGPTSPVFPVGEPITVECELLNSGTAIARKLEAEFLLSGIPHEMVRASANQIVPGGRVLLQAAFPARKGPQRGLYLTLSRWRSEDLKETEPHQHCFVIVVDTAELPAPSGSLKAAVAGDYGILENENVRLAFLQVSFVETGAGGRLPDKKTPPLEFVVGELSVKTPRGWQRVAWLRPLATFFWFDEEGSFSGFLTASSRPSRADAAPGTAAGLSWVEDDALGRYRLRMKFDLNRGAKTINARYEFELKKRGSRVHFGGPSLCVLDRNEAVFPGVEWLVGEEQSSSSLDIAEGHRDRIRAVVDPNWITIPAIGIHGRHGTVGVLWNSRQKWDATHDRPGVYFCSPEQNAHDRSHHVKMFLPNAPEFKVANEFTITGAKPYCLEPGKPIRLEAHIYADGTAPDALSAIDEWIKIYGFPKPAPLPHGTYEKEIEFSMQAYLKSLWVPEEKKWWTSKGAGELLSPKGLPRPYVADLLVGELLCPDREVQRQCRARADEVLKILGGPARLDAQRFPGRVDAGLANPAEAAGLLMARGKDGAWRFDADQEGTGPFVGMDYHELGPDNAAELGTCAARAKAILRYARITGDWEAYRQTVKTLEFMEQFRVPRAAQVWEVPVHSPDILAAAEAVEAYLEAYRFSGEKRWLRDAVTWARRGLPFVYLWEDPQKPFLVGASIPVFGASWMQASWFGRPVQWNGLRYAEALLDLAEHDQSYPWRQLATALTHSAIHQQEQGGENAALWPDSIGAVQGDKSGWIFAPRMILTNILKLMGRGEEIRTTIVGSGERRLHLSANADLREAKWDGNVCTFRITYPAGEQGTAVVFNVARPRAVLLDGKTLSERPDLEEGTEPGWRYDPAIACLSVRVPKDGPSEVRLEGAAFRATPWLPQPADRIAFEFAGSPEGWLPMHDMDDPTVRDGSLTGHFTGGDPYLGRIMLHVRGDECPTLVLRMRVTAGQGGQLFWMTEASPSFTEDKSIHFNVQPDGQFHEYRLETGKHPAWAGQTITALRIDPCDGAASGDFAIDYVRGGK